MSDFAQQFQNQFNHQQQFQNQCGYFPQFTQQNSSFGAFSNNNNNYGSYQRYNRQNTTQNNSNYNHKRGFKKNYDHLYDKLKELVSLGSKAIDELNALFGKSKCAVVNYNDIIATKTPYDAGLIARFKELKGKFFKEAKCWIFLPQQRQEVEQSISSVFNDFANNQYAKTNQPYINNANGFMPQMQQMAPMQQMQQSQPMQNQSLSYSIISLNELMQALNVFNTNNTNTLKVGNCVLLRKDINDQFTQRAMQAKGIYIQDLGAWLLRCDQSY